MCADLARRNVGEAEQVAFQAQVVRPKNDLHVMGGREEQLTDAKPISMLAVALTATANGSEVSGLHRLSRPWTSRHFGRRVTWTYIVALGWPR